MSKDEAIEHSSPVKDVLTIGAQFWTRKTNRSGRETFHRSDGLQDWLDAKFYWTANEPVSQLSKSRMDAISNAMASTVRSHWNRSQLWAEAKEDQMAFRQLLRTKLISLLESTVEELKIPESEFSCSLHSFNVDERESKSENPLERLHAGMLCLSPFPRHRLRSSTKQIEHSARDKP